MEPLDIFEYVSSRFIPCSILPIVDYFTFQQSEENFKSGVACTVAYGSYTANYILTLEQLRLITASKLRPAFKEQHHIMFTLTLPDPHLDSTHDHMPFLAMMQQPAHGEFAE